MAKIDNHRAESPRGLRRDMRQVRTHGNASMQELREFLGSMKGRRPQEVLGLIAQSSLVQGMFWSTMIVAVLLVGLTFASWGIKKSRGDFEPVAQKPAAGQATEGSEGQPTSGGDNTAPAGGNSANNGNPSGPADSATGTSTAPPASAPADPAAAIADPLGIGEARMADPKVNPLDNRGDDILLELNKP